MKIDIVKNRAIINLLGEICWGFEIDNFEDNIGAKEEIVEALLERLLGKERLGVIETSLNESEVAIIKSALCIVEKEIEEWEFQTRIGILLEEVKAMPIFTDPFVPKQD
jgi:hypothetical protein